MSKAARAFHVAYVIIWVSLATASLWVFAVMLDLLSAAIALFTTGYAFRVVLQFWRLRS